MRHIILTTERALQPWIQTLVGGAASVAAAVEQVAEDSIREKV